MIEENKQQKINNEPGFILSSSPWKESSLLLEVFSKNYGKIYLVARSARRTQSELRGVLSSFIPISFSFFGKGELQTIHRIKWIGGWQQPKNQSLISALYVNELVSYLFAKHDPHPSVFDHLCTIMKKLSVEKNDHHSLRIFEWNLLKDLGYGLNLEADQNNQELNKDTNYLIYPHSNPIPYQDSPIDQKTISVSGLTLIEIRNGNLCSQKSLEEALLLNRHLIGFILNTKTLYSREILKQLNLLKNTLDFE